MKTMYVYIVECSDKKYYTGVTNDIERRLLEHNEGIDKKSFTYTRRPVKLVYCEKFIDPNQAIEFEKQVKGWSRAKKQALIKRDWETLVNLSNLKNKSRSV